MKKIILTHVSCLTLFAAIAFLGCSAEQPAPEISQEESADLAEEEANAAADAQPIPDDSDGGEGE
ncbi:MAG: hypothetical protein ACJZ68_07655 [Limisphaerales bacterium]